jgi:dynein heavy chain, axonemal
MIEHFSRISRIIQKPQGHGLLVSLGGNGRTTLMKLAAFLNSSTLTRMDFGRAYGRSEWLDDMKSIFKQAGIEDHSQVLTMAAADAVNCSGALEDVCSIANAGEFPNLFSAEDIEEIIAEVGKQARHVSQADPLSLF